jgi:macrolide transport system ATP-binding/permease protein
METLLQDLRYGMRMLLKRPGFTVIAIISLALGIGANTAIFSLVNTALLMPPPVARPDELVAVNNSATGQMFPTISYPNYKDYRDRNEIFSGLVAYRFAPLSVSHEGINERLWSYIVSGNYFEVLGINPAAGRLISTEDDQLPGAHPVAVLSYKYWQSRFGGDAGVIGRSLIVNGRSFTVIGVAPRGFYGTEVISAPEMWFPMAMQAQIEVGNDWLNERGVENIFMQGRLKPGVSKPQAEAALNSIAAQLESEYPNFNEGKRVKVASPGLMGGMMRGAVMGFAGLLMAVVGLVLLLACTNLANLLLARVTERRKEIAVRLALGASRFRLVRQLLTESVLLAVIGGALGLLLAFWIVDLVAAFKPPINVPLAIELQIDHRVLLFTGAISIVTGILFGLLPALQATKTDLVSALKDEAATGGYRRSYLKNGLIVFQVALSLVLLISGGLMLRGLQRAQTLELGFIPQNAVEVSFDLRLQGYDRARSKEFQKQLLERVRAMPGVEGAGIADLVPVDLHFSSSSVLIEGRAPERSASAPRALNNRISPGYFSAMGTRLIEGRDFTEQDDEKAARVAIVNETFARRYWPNEAALGKRFSLGGPDAPMMEVVGVAQDGKYAGLTEDARPFFYRPIWQSYSGTSNLIVRSETDLQRLLAELRNELAALDPQLPTSGKTMVEHLSFPLFPARIAASLLGSFGVLALLLAAIGLYGVMSYTISKRTREIGIRMALGAQSRDVMNMVLRQGMTLAAAGVVIGLVAAFALTRVMTSLLYGVNATDPATFGLVALLLSGVALAACYIPARRALKVDPMVALRHE